MPLKRLRDHVTYVLEEVEAVGDLHGVRSALLAASAYSSPWFRLTTSTPGCSESQKAKLSALLSGRTSTSSLRSRFTKTVPSNSHYRPLFVPCRGSGPNNVGVKLGKMGEDTMLGIG